MKMYSLPNFCRVCLKYDKNLIDLAHIENEPSETLMSKLEQCVSEVDWSAYKPLLCHPCIKRLNIAFNFKKQCVQSASVLRNYLDLVKENQKKINESQNSGSGEGSADLQTSPGAFMVLPNQKFVKIVVGPQQTNSYQNVFLNLIPGNMSPPALAPVSSLVSGESLSTTKDTNQNVFVNLSSTMSKFVPIAPNKSSKSVNQILTDSKTEELSVEIDPTIFGMGGTDSDTSENKEEKDESNDWDEVISQSQLRPIEIAKLNGDKPKILKKIGAFVPILPKHASDLFTGKHFLSSDACFEGEVSENPKKFNCESCQKNFPTMKILKNHIKLFHMGKYPFKCPKCFVEYVTRSDFEECLESHKKVVENTAESSLTLKDFANSQVQAAQSASDDTEMYSYQGEENMIECDLCKREFHSQTGLLRHKVRKHNQKNKKKYFIKGMKNAKCDICNREFSTLSYMHLHRKLHMRDDVGYKYKVLGKSKYDEKVKVKKSSPAVKLKVEVAPETIDVTPDITLEREMDEDSEPEEQSIKSKRKYTKLRETRPELEITKIVKVKEENIEEDSDENALHMDIEDNIEVKIEEIEDIEIKEEADFESSAE